MRRSAVRLSSTHTHPQTHTSHQRTHERNSNAPQGSLNAFALFASIQRGLDGFLFEVPHPAAGSTLEEFAFTVGRVLTGLALRDPSGRNCVDKSYVGYAIRVIDCRV